MTTLRHEIEEGALKKAEKAQEVANIAQQFFREGSISTKDLREVLEGIQEGYPSLAQERLERALASHLLEQASSTDTDPLSIPHNSTTYPNHQPPMQGAAA